MKGTSRYYFFDGFELLDAFGPIELFSAVPGVKIELLAARIGPVRSAQGIEVIAELEYGDLNEPDIIFVPGGRGTRSLAQDNSFLSWLMDIGSRSEIVASVCTGIGALGRGRSPRRPSSDEQQTSFLDGRPHLATIFLGSIKRGGYTTVVDGHPRVLQPAWI